MFSSDEVDNEKLYTSIKAILIDHFSSIEMLFFFFDKMRVEVDLFLNEDNWLFWDKGRIYKYSVQQFDSRLTPAFGIEATRKAGVLRNKMVH